jgi:hypothetical protein
VRLPFLLALAGACGSSNTSFVPLTSADVAQPGPADAKDGAGTIASRPELRVAIAAPASAPYVPAAAGPASPSVALYVTNTGPSPANVQKMHVSFTAARDGVAFPCKDRDAAGLHDREPSWLKAGDRVKYERVMDCAMLALGRYEVTVFVRFGDPTSAPLERAGEFTFDVTPGGPAAPHPLPGRPEIQVALAGDAFVRPLPAYAWKRGDFRILAVFVNTSATPVMLPPMRATLAVASKARPLDCTNDLLETYIGAVKLLPGHPRSFALPVRCNLETEGEYEIRATLATSDAGPFALGRLNLWVKSEPDVPRLPDDQREWLH